MPVSSEFNQFLYQSSKNKEVTGQSDNDNDNYLRDLCSMEFADAEQDQ